MKTRQTIAGLLVGVWMGSAASATEGGAPMSDLTLGRRLYEQHCAPCHGVNGDGQGPAAVWLYPKPRNFSAGVFKIQSTPPGTLPSDEDLFRSITRGLPGSAMPGFGYLSETQRWALVGYVKYLTAYTNAGGRRINRFEEQAAAGVVSRPIEVPPEPPVTVQSLALGREVYTRMQCYLCHGETGAGDGPQVPLLKDSFGLPARPRDFNTERFRGGSSGRDLYLRIRIGLAGTPMVPYGDDVMTPEERWALVHYIRSLRRTDVAVNDLLQPEDNRIPVQRVRRLPTDPLDPAWEELETSRVPLHPLWPEPQQVYAVAVRAVTDGRRLAIWLQWRDPLPQEQALRVEDFQDAAAVQFALGAEPAFLGMGDRDHPVNLWHWKAAWQAELDARSGPDIARAHPAMHVDTYFQPERHFVTARDAGNFVALAHRTPVEDANARGFGSFQSQPPSGQNVQGRGVWMDESWTVVFIRDLKSRESDDVQFVRGRPVPVAFAVWNGEQGDRNGRKMISYWYQLVWPEQQARTTGRGRGS
ncbi:ethylbenzene dehydrogenase-related protein [Limisphaera sp. 4302-co]|uniref:ethylbenzene dehydrogenase-related protein n=1 Tax=Limisphaera sp. 4302-co TaxID=3400417 RepID=UPI003C1630AC